MYMPSSYHTNYGSPPQQRYSNPYTQYNPYVGSSYSAYNQPRQYYQDHSSQQQPHSYYEEPVRHPQPRYSTNYEPERMITSHIRYEAPIPTSPWQDNFRNRNNYPYTVSQPVTHDLQQSTQQRYRKKIFEEESPQRQPPIDSLIQKYRNNPQSGISQPTIQQPGQSPMQPPKFMHQSNPIHPITTQKYAERERKQIFVKDPPTRDQHPQNNPYLQHSDEETFKDFKDFNDFEDHKPTQQPPQTDEFMELFDKPQSTNMQNSKPAALQEDQIHQRANVTSPLPTPVVLKSQAKVNTPEEIKKDKKMLAIAGALGGIAVLMVLATLISYYFQN